MSRILVVRPDRVGDVVLITPLIRSLRESFPASYLGALVRSKTKAVLEGNPRLNTIITDDGDGDDRGFNGFWRKVTEVRKHRFDAALLVYPTQRAAYLLFAAGIRRRIGVGHILYEVLTFMQSIGSRQFVPLRHEADYALDFARKLGAAHLSLEPEIFLSEEEQRWAQEELRRLNASHPVVSIHPTSGGSAPNWRLERYIELAQRLAKSGVSVIVESPHRLPIGREGIINATGRYSLRELICLISAVDVCVSSSTGPMHIAAALGVPTVSMFCPLPACSPSLWGPLGNKGEVVVAPDWYCSKVCPGDPHLCDFEGGIGVEEVYRRVRAMLEKR